MSADFFSESEFTIEELQGILAEVRKLCNKPDIEACTGLDELFARILERDRSQTDFTKEESEIDYVAGRIEKLKSEINALEVFPSNFKNLNESLAQLGKYWNPSAKRRFEVRLSELRAQGEVAVKEAHMALIPSYERRLETLAIELAAYADTPEVFQQIAQRFQSRLRGDFDETLARRLPGENERLRRRAEEIIQECQEKHHQKALDEALEGIHVSTPSTTRLLRALRLADRFFSGAKKTDLNLEGQFRLAFETVAWARSRKLLSEAEFFGASGNGKRSRTLYAQAQIALNQDWPKVFGKAPFPDFPRMQMPQPPDGSVVDSSH